MTQMPYTPEPLPVSEPVSQPAPPALLAGHRRGLTFALVGVLLAALVAAVLLLTLGGTSERPLKVTLALFDSDATCTEGGSGGYDDISPGMPVTVRDQDGKLIGSSTLPEEGDFYRGVGCEWSMVIIVPDDAEQYAVEGGSRGALTYSRADLEKNDWVAELALGQ